MIKKEAIINYLSEKYNLESKDVIYEIKLNNIGDITFLEMYQDDARL